MISATLISPISIWTLSLPETLTPSQADSLHQQLSEPEKARLAKINAPKRRLEYLMGHVLLRQKTAEMLGIPPAKVPLVCEEGKKPRLGQTQGSAPTFVSLSHTSGLVVCAVSPVPIGIDVEIIRPRPQMQNVARKFFSPEEAKELESLKEPEKISRFRELWVLHEARYKACGASGVVRRAPRGWRSSLYTPTPSHVLGVVYLSDSPLQLSFDECQNLL